MAENNKPEIVYHPRTREIAGKEGETFIVTNPGFTQKCLNKYEVVFELFQIPAECFETCEALSEIDAACKARYDGGLNDVLTAGVRQLTTRPNYKVAGFGTEPQNVTETEDPDKPGKPFIDAELLEGGHEAMQKAADEYKIGRQAVGESVKKKAAKYDELETKLAESGKTIEELLADLD